ncbi:MAG: tetratricopeptide repeat protein, partial [Acidobacteriales bacterium]|nr:tetratricopeptide repeat protein [Terriglobales bacterium]
DKSLIWREAGGRYQLHELLCQYAEERLNEDVEEVQRVYDAHAAYYVDFLYQRKQDVVGLRQRETFREIAREQDNIRVTWRRIIENADITAIYKAGYTYYEFGDLQGRYQETAHTFESAIACLAALESTSQRDLTLATIQALIGWIYIRLGQFDEARMAFQTSVSMFRDLGVRPQPGFGTEGLSGLGLLELTLGNYAEAIAFGEAARDQSEAANDKLNLQIALYVLANATYSQGKYEAALRHAQLVYDLSEATGNRWFTAHIVAVMGNITRELEDYDRAWDYYQTSFAFKQEFDDLDSMAFALNGMAGIARIRGDYPEAARLYQQGYDLYRQVNDPGGLGTSLLGLGDTAQAQ